MPTGFRSPHHTPCNAVARTVQTAKRPFQPLHTGQKRLFADLDIVHHDLAGDRCAQAQLATDLGRAQPLHALVQHKPANLAAMGFGFGPDHENIGNRRIADPHLGPVQHIATRRLFRGGFHPRRVGPRIRFGQPETADQRACRQPGQIFRALRIGPIGMDRIHHQGRLH